MVECTFCSLHQTTRIQNGLKGLFFLINRLIFFIISSKRHVLSIAIESFRWITFVKTIVMLATKTKSLY